MKWAFVIAFVLIVVGVAGGAQRPKYEDRHYWPVTVAKMATNKHTHVAVTDTVKLVRHEMDGDLHIRLGQAPFITAECIPELMCPEPKLGQIITVYGISRFDGEHKWYEVHPIERWELAK